MKTDQDRDAALWLPLVLCSLPLLYLSVTFVGRLASAAQTRLRPVMVWEWLGVAALAAGCGSPVMLLAAGMFMVWGVRTNRLKGARLLVVGIIFAVSAFASWHFLRNVLFLGGRWS